MVAGAAYSAYQNYQAAEADQAALRQQSAFHREYLREIDRRQATNEKLARQDIQKTQDQTIVNAAALGKDVGGDATLSALEDISILGTEQILRDRQEFAWERHAAKFKQLAMEQQIEVSETTQRTRLYNDLLSAGFQFSKFTNSDVKS